MLRALQKCARMRVRVEGGKSVGIVTLLLLATLSSKMGSSFEFSTGLKDRRTGDFSINE